VLLGKRQLKNGMNKPCVHWMVDAFLVHEICGYCNIVVYVQLIISTTRRYFRERQHGPTWKCMHPKNKPTKHARNHGNLMKRISKLHERAINSKKRSHCYLFLRKCRKVFNFCWRSKAIVEPQSAPQKTNFWGGTIYKRGILSRFPDKRSNRSHLRGAPKTKMA